MVFGFLVIEVEKREVHANEPPVAMCVSMFSDVVRCILIFTYGIVNKPSFVRNRAQTFTDVIVQSKADLFRLSAVLSFIYCCSYFEQF